MPRGAILFQSQHAGLSARRGSGKTHSMKKLSPAAYRPLLRAALREDLGSGGDVTTRFFVPAQARFKARVT